MINKVDWPLFTYKRCHVSYLETNVNGPMDIDERLKSVGKSLKEN